MRLSNHTNEISIFQSSHKENQYNPVNEFIFGNASVTYKHVSIECRMFFSKEDKLEMIGS